MRDEGGDEGRPIMPPIALLVCPSTNQDEEIFRIIRIR